MEYMVKIFNKKNQLISDEVWYGSSLEHVKIWIEFAINSMTLEISHYEIENKAS